MIFEEIKLQNSGILKAEVPKDIFDDLKQTCTNNIQNKNVGYALKRNSVQDYTVQGIEEALPIKVPTSFNDFLIELASTYTNYFDVKMPGNQNASLTHVWLNLQKKYEYRPFHNHNGGGGEKYLSFVTYIKIPYTLQDEDSYPNHTNKATVHRNGRIEFIYDYYDGKRGTKLLEIDQSYEGQTIVFPSSFSHIVYPFFTSDEYRISLAGNITFG